MILICKPFIDLLINKLCMYFMFSQGQAQVVYIYIYKAYPGTSQKSYWKIINRVMSPENTTYSCKQFVYFEKAGYFNDYCSHQCNVINNNALTYHV